MSGKDEKKSGYEKAGFFRKTAAASTLSHPVAYSDPYGPLHKVETPPNFAVRLDAVPVAISPSDVGFSSTDNSVVSMRVQDFSVEQELAHLRLEVWPKRPGSCKVQFGKLRPPVNGDEYKRFLDGERFIEYPMGTVDVDVVALDERFICRLGEGSVAVHAVPLLEYSLARNISVAAKTPRSSVVAAILSVTAAMDKKVSTAGPNTLGPNTRHLVLCAHSSDSNVLSLGEGFRRASDPTKYEEFGNDPITGDASALAPLRGQFRVIWLMSCSAGLTTRSSNFVSGVAKVTGAWVIASTMPLPLLPRYRKDGGKYVGNLPLLERQVDWPVPSLIYPPGDGLTLPASVSTAHMLSRRRNLGFKIVEYGGLDVASESQ